LVLDAGKGGAAVLAARAFAGEDAAQLAGGAAFLGHLFPVYLGFRGGKGVATFLGTVMAVAWPVGIAACLSWLAFAGGSRMSSVGALGAAGLAPVWAWGLGYPTALVLCVALAALVILRHHANITRIAQGTEPRIGKGK
jgi:glycerol-3-phosphate acyltransferase PlsY